MHVLKQFMYTQDHLRTTSRSFEKDLNVLLRRFVPGSAATEGSLSNKPAAMPATNPAAMVHLLLSFVALGTRAESATTQPFYGPTRRELQTAVSTVESLTNELTNPDIGHIVLAPGTYILSAELSVTRSVIIEAAVADSVVLDAQASEADGNQRGVLNINPGSSGVVQINGLNITGGYTVEVSAAETCN